MGRRKYCSVKCRQRLRRTLNMRTGLLRALNTRYATFYFTPNVIVMDLMPYGSREIFSFMFRRTPTEKPVDDFCRMANLLGNTWWAEKRRTNKNYLASRLLFDHAKRHQPTKTAVNPVEVKIPTVRHRSLVHLKLTRDDLDAPHLHTTIKKAYRTQAKRHHPDTGGDATVFRRIHQAYQDLLDWAEHPTFVRRRGFPDKWFYNGHTNRWVQPAPLPKI